MFKIDLNHKLFKTVALLIIFSNVLLTIYMYDKVKSFIETRAYHRAETLKNYFSSMRYVYHQQFMKSDLKIDDSTIGFLPAHASSLISDKFSELSNNDISLRNVTNRPRNPVNKADVFEEEAMEYFKENPSADMHLAKISKNNKRYLNYTYPLKIEQYCLKCHGTKEEAMPSIRERYDTGYDYKLGEIRGVTSIKIPLDSIADQTMEIFYKTMAMIWFSIIFLLTIIHFAIKALMKKDIEQKEILKKEVEVKTSYLKKQQSELQHLFGILKTVKDFNQILINAKDVDELIKNTTLSMHSNTSFANVKISLCEDGELVVKSSVGIIKETEITQLERDVFDNNRYIFLKNFDETLHEECMEKVKKYGIIEIYSLPLRKYHNAQEALGTITIYSKEERGFSKEERDMIDELSGDIGFAINSFYQKEAINKLSFYDPLTNLANQSLFEKHITQALENSYKNMKYGALMFMDIDNFKSVNDLMGQDEGNIVLKETANRLAMQLKDVSMISRFGSDKFLVLVENLSNKQESAAVVAEEYAKQILEITKEPFTLKDKTFYLTCSIGIALFFDDVETAALLLNQAEYAMRTAKKDGKNIIRFYDSSLQESTKSRSLLIQNIKEALKERRFFVLYQKQFDKDKKAVGAEALIRWQHPTIGIISPAEFIPLAEESGVIKEIGRFVLDNAADLLTSWAKDDAKKEWRISVNVSPLQFRDAGFVNEIKELISTKMIDPNKLRLELTEGVLIDNQKSAMKKIEELNAFGVSLSIDDFGTGYSSLGYLKHLKIDELKIDQSFVMGLLNNNSDKTIVKTIIMMGKEFNFEVIAEGVETKEQFELLKEMGCDLFQGFHLSKPSRAEDL